MFEESDRKIISNVGRKEKFRAIRTTFGVKQLNFRGYVILNNVLYSSFKTISYRVYKYGTLCPKSSCETWRDGLPDL